MSSTKPFTTAWFHELADEPVYAGIASVIAGVASIIVDIETDLNEKYVVLFGLIGVLGPIILQIWWFSHKTSVSTTRLKEVDKMIDFGKRPQNRKQRAAVAEGISELFETLLARDLELHDNSHGTLHRMFLYSIMFDVREYRERISNGGTEIVIRSKEQGRHDEYFEELMNSVTTSYFGTNCVDSGSPLRTAFPSRIKSIHANARGRVRANNGTFERLYLCDFDKVNDLETIWLPMTEQAKMGIRVFFMSIKHYRTEYRQQVNRLKGYEDFGLVDERVLSKLQFDGTKGTRTVIITDDEQQLNVAKYLRTELLRDSKCFRFNEALFPSATQFVNIIRSDLAQYDYTEPPKPPPPRPPE